MYSGAPSSPPGVICFAASPGLGKQDQLPCSILERDGKCLRLQTQHTVSLASILGIEYDDLYCAGEVVGCAHQEDGSWIVQVAFEQVITSLQSLILLHQKLGIVDTPPVPGQHPRTTMTENQLPWGFAGAY